MLNLSWLCCSWLKMNVALALMLESGIEIAVWGAQLNKIQTPWS